MASATAWRDDRARPANKQVLRAPRTTRTAARSPRGGTIRYDTLVIAIGSLSNDFGTPGVAEHAIALDTPEQAARFHRRLVNACMRAHTQDGPVRPGQLHVAIIGAGATGIELRPSCTDTRAIVAYGLDRIDPDKDIKITLIEAARASCRRCPSACRRRHGHLRSWASRAHQRRVTEVRAERRAARRRRVRSRRARGLGRRVKAPTCCRSRRAGVSRAPAGRQPTLQTTRDDNIFAIGDCAACRPKATGGRCRRGRRPRTSSCWKPKAACRPTRPGEGDGRRRPVVGHRSGELRLAGGRL